MLKLGTSDLAYVGDRPYIRGADLLALFDNLLRAQRAPSPPVRYERFRLVRGVTRDGTWWLADTDMSPTMPKTAATLAFEDTTGGAWLARFIEDGALITRHVPDIPSVIETLTEDGVFAGTARLKPLVQRRDLVDGLIEANKALHTAELERRGLSTELIRLVYIEDLPVVDIHRGESAITLVFRHLGERRTGDRCYTLNAVDFEGVGAAVAPAIVCYSY